jgi:ADP-ribose pyrophosphatase
MSSREDYRALITSHPELFVNPPDAGIEILLDEDDIRQAETYMEQQLTANGGSAEWARVGIAFRDQYMTVVRDAVRFPNGQLGTYIRSLSSHPEMLGVAMLPVWQGQVLLVRHFRHGSRSWNLEIPRGFGMAVDSATSAREELREEIGAVASRLVELGEFSPDGGGSASRVALFFAEVESFGQPETAEAISDILPTPVPEFERMIAGAELTDGFLLAAYARAKAKGLI